MTAIRLFTPRPGLLSLLTAILVAASVWLMPPAQADQTNPALNTLFTKLQSEDGGALAPELTAKIWLIWHQTSDLTVERHLRSGIAAMNAGDFALAANEFDTVVTLAPNFAEGWNKRATLRFITGQYRESIADCGKVLELEPRHFGALSGLGLIHAQLGEDTEALLWFEQAVKVNPHMPGAQQNIETIKNRLRGKAI